MDEAVVDIRNRAKTRMANRANKGDEYESDKDENKKHNIFTLYSNADEQAA